MSLARKLQSPCSHYSKPDEFFKTCMFYLELGMHHIFGAASRAAASCVFIDASRVNAVFFSRVIAIWRHASSFFKLTPLLPARSSSTPSCGQIRPFLPSGHPPRLLAANLSPPHLGFKGRGVKRGGGWRRRETRDGRRETRDNRRETGDGRWEMIDDRRETGEGRWKTGEERQETGDRRCGNG